MEDVKPVDNTYHHIDYRGYAEESIRENQATKSANISTSPCKMMCCLRHFEAFGSLWGIHGKDHNRAC